MFTSPTEIELKLRLQPENVSRLQRCTLLRTLSISRSVTRKVHSIYYDTGNFDLRRSNTAFRLRRTGKRWVQTIKGGGNAIVGLHQRFEWEAPVLKAQPDFNAISDPALFALFDDAGLREKLHPVFITEFNRSTRILRLADNSEVEFCLDRGRIITPERSIPFCEMELELKSGSPGLLFEFALDLLRIVPLRLENVSKAERGYALISRRKPSPLRATPVALVAEMQVSKAFKAIAWNCLNHLHSNEAGMLEDRDMEYLHQMRVALRRERSAFGIFSSAFSRAAFNPMAKDLKWLAGQLRPARDWDVFVTGTLASVCASFNENPGMLALREKCEQIRCRHKDVARDAVESKHYTGVMLKLGAWLSAESWLVSRDRSTSSGEAEEASWEPIKVFSAAMLSHRHKQLKKHGKKLKSFDAPELHALRIMAKKQRYAAEFFAGLYSHKKAKRYIKSLAALQDVLGVINDNAVIVRLLDELPAGEDGTGEREAIGIIRGWSASLALTRKRELDNVWRVFDKNNPFW
ncbi:MAG: CYTH and CHAD domain-containing protein [Nitrosospira sp.]|nr:CYTH and CHAD domain-containing protein [Nitrosospira sp.]